MKVRASRIRSRALAGSLGALVVAGVAAVPLPTAGADTEPCAEPLDPTTTTPTGSDACAPTTAAASPPSSTEPAETTATPTESTSMTTTTLAETATTAPDSTAPETTAPDTTAPDTTAPDTTAPDTTAPDTTAPETTAPDTTAPDSTAPGSTAPTAPPTTPPSVPPAEAPTSVPTTGSAVTTSTTAVPAPPPADVVAPTAPATEPDPGRTPSTPAADPSRVPSTLAGEVADPTKVTSPSSLTADDTATAPAPTDPTASPSIAASPLPPVNVDWQTPGVGRPPALGAPGAQPPVAGRVPAVTRGTTTTDVDVILATIRQLESGGNYAIGPNKASASGAYQYISSTWNGYAGYTAAYLAPQEVQDARARADVERILSTYAGDASMVPVIWYFPLAAREPSWMDRVPNPAGGNKLTVRQYQQRWLDILATKRTELSGPVFSQPDPVEPAAISVLTSMPTAAPAPVPQATPVAPSSDAVTFDAVTVSAETMALAARSAPPAGLPPHGAGWMRTIVFPVLGPVTYVDGWGDCRDGCRRRHVGTDIIGVRMQPLLSVVDGTVTRIRWESRGTAGAIITITDADGWAYNYFHVNNDTPGSDDAHAATAWQTPPRLEVGDQVKAGQIIGYMGDSGNSEGSVPHLHFEIRDPKGTAHPSFWSLEAAKARQACTVGVGPWSAPGPDPLEPLDGKAITDDPVLVTAVRPLFGDGSWLIDTEGRVTATGDAALIVPGKDLACAPGPMVPFGTDGAGWTTSGVEADVLDGTALATTDPVLLAQSGLVLPAADAGAEVLAFQDPSTGETILVTMPALVPFGAARRTLQAVPEAL